MSDMISVEIKLPTRNREAMADDLLAISAAVRLGDLTRLPSRLFVGKDGGIISVIREGDDGE